MAENLLFFDTVVYYAENKYKGTSINYFLILEAPPKSPVFAIYRWLLYE